MARDPRKNSAFDSGLRGGDKSKLTSPQASASSGGGSRHQGAGSKIGNPDGEGSAYSSGMRGGEKSKRPRSAHLSDANDRQNDSTDDHASHGGERTRTGSSVIGNPEGETGGAVNRGTPNGVNSGTMQQHTQATRLEPGSDSPNALENANGMSAPEAHEDETHINVRIPKSSIRRGQR